MNTLRTWRKFKRAVTHRHPVRTALTVTEKELGTRGYWTLQERRRENVSVSAQEVSAEEKRDPWEVTCP